MKFNFKKKINLFFFSSEGEGGYSKWRWIDNWPLTRSNWAGNHPQKDVYGPCAFMNQNGQFESTECYDPRPFVCKAEFYDNTLEWDNSALGDPVGCDPGWTLIGLHCLKVFRQELSYNDARSDCIFRNSHLVSIHTPNYNALVTGTLIKITDCQIFDQNCDFWPNEFLMNIFMNFFMNFLMNFLMNFFY